MEISFYYQIGLVLLGAIFSSILSYIVATKRENKLLKNNLQIKAAEELLNTIRNYDKTLTELYYDNYLYNLKTYNNLLKRLKELENSLEEIEHSSTEYIEIVFAEEIAEEKVIRNFFNQTKESLFNDEKKFRELWVNHSEILLSIIYMLELKEVIFNKFVGIRDLLTEDNKNLIELYNKIFSYYNFEFASKIISYEILEDHKIDNILEYKNMFNEKMLDMSTYISSDLKNELQNEFLSKLFNYKVPIRKTNNENYKVYKAGYVHNIKYKYIKGFKNIIKCIYKESKYILVLIINVIIKRH